MSEASHRPDLLVTIRLLVALLVASVAVPAPAWASFTTVDQSHAYPLDGAVWAYGAVRSGQDPGSIGYAGAMRDSATGYLNLRHRWYSPELGRFLSQDPIGLAGGLNAYAYAGGNPVDRRDPTGLDDLIKADYDPATGTWVSTDVSFPGGSVGRSPLANATNLSQSEFEGYVLGMGLGSAGTVIPPLGYALGAFGVAHGIHSGIYDPRATLFDASLEVGLSALYLFGLRASPLAGGNCPPPTGFLGRRGFELQNPLYQPARNQPGSLRGID